MLCFDAACHIFLWLLGALYVATSGATGGRPCAPVAQLSQELRHWKHAYNTVRPLPRPWAISRPRGSLPHANPKPRRLGFTNLLDEYTGLNIEMGRGMIHSW